MIEAWRTCKHIAYVSGNSDPEFPYGIRCRRCHMQFDAAALHTDAVVMVNDINGRGK